MKEPEIEKNKPDIRAPYVFLATWFGAGLIKKAPGTWGSLAAIPPALLIIYFAGVSAFLSGIIVISIVGFWAAARFDKAMGGHDNKMIVIDEVAGQWIALVPVFVLYGFHPVMVFVSFALFRLFDITKPWPISWVDRNLGGAAGVMFDDILAGLGAAICIYGGYHAGLG